MKNYLTVEEGNTKKRFSQEDVDFLLASLRFNKMNKKNLNKIETDGRNYIMGRNLPGTSAFSDKDLSKLSNLYTGKGLFGNKHLNIDISLPNGDTISHQSFNPSTSSAIEKLYKKYGMKSDGTKIASDISLSRILARALLDR